MKKVLFIFFCFFFSCSKYSDDIENVLQQAGKNRKELEKVLKHYGKNTADSLKLRAAEFLIVNMPGKYSEYYDAPWNDVSTVMLRWTSSPDKQLVLDTYHLGEPVRKDDIEHITANYLINNIELAFKVWREMPWGKDLPFDVFCEEILPYRVSTEQLENWREKVLASFAVFYNAFREDTTGITSLEACKQVNEKLPQFRIDNDYPPMNFSQIMATTRGTCENMVSLSIFVMRGLGIPVTCDFSCLQYAFPTGHSWNSVNDCRGSYHSFMPTEKNPGEWHLGISIYKAKVYRRSYANQQPIVLDESQIPPLLKNINHMVDVTCQYGSCVDVSVLQDAKGVPESNLIGNDSLFKHLQHTGPVFLAIYHKKKWHPIGWGFVDGDSMRFQSLQSGLYMPVFYCNGAIIPAAYPFSLDNNNNLHILQPDTMQTLLLTSIAEVNVFISMRMLCGKFEAANKNDFSDARTIHSIQTYREPYFHHVSINPATAYRYVRYVTPNGVRCAVTMLEFYDENNVKLQGNVIGTPGINGTTCENVFDGNMETVFISDTVYSWVGLDLGKPHLISKIRYLPLIDGNAIYEGHVYELLYWDGNKWSSLGRKTADSHFLSFEAPGNALFMLENITKNRKNSKPFYMKDGKQQWLKYD